MKRSIQMFLVISFGLLLFACNEQPSTAPEIAQNEYDENTMAKKPVPKLIGEIWCDFNLGNYPFVWEGTVDFGGGVVHGIQYESLGFPVAHGQSSHFEERFKIYNLADENIIYLAGYDFGVLVYSNLEGRMRGVVDEANPPYEDWLGRRVNMGGTAIMTPTGDPLAFDGWIRLH